MTQSGYGAEYAAWQADPVGWWEAQAEALMWRKRWTQGFEPALGAFGQYFAGGSLNISENCLDRHVEAGRGEQVALIWDSAMAGPKPGIVERFTYRELRDRVARLAGALAARGVGYGDRVVVYMPMVPSALVAMLACARLGAIHSVVFGGFAAAELAKRIEDATPKAIISASCGLEPGRVVPYKPLLDAAIELSAHKPAFCLILQRPALAATLIAGRDEDLFEAETSAAPHDPVPVAATDPLYILYTSGTTGKPKGVVRDTGGYAVALHRTMAMIYGIQPGEVFWCASDVGWVVGHSYIIYAPLLVGAGFRSCTRASRSGRRMPVRSGAFAPSMGVKALFTAPTALRAIKQRDPTGALTREYDLSKLETLFLAGERCDPPTALWAAETLGIPVVDHWWQTETGWPDYRGVSRVRPLSVQARFRRAALPGLRSGGAGR